MVVVRYFAGARAAAGVAEEKVDAGSLAELATVVVSSRPGLASVLAVASFLVDGLVWHDRAAPLPDDATVDILPPFAGG
jgi:molybdopterin synthase sulfur carrier subunit